MHGSQWRALDAPVGERRISEIALSSLSNFSPDRHRVAVHIDARRGVPLIGLESVKRVRAATSTACEARDGCGVSGITRKARAANQRMDATRISLRS